MNIYRQNYKSKDGRTCKTSKFYIELLDHNKLRHKIPAFTDKRVSEAFGRNIESLINCRTSGLEPDIKLNQWLETLPSHILKKFTNWGIIDGQRTEITKPLTEHIVDYIKTLEAKGFSKGYIKPMRYRLKKIIADCRFNYFRDITSSAVDIYSGKLKTHGYSDTSRGHYIDSLKTFLNWAVQDQRILNNPIARVAKPVRKSKRKGILIPEQFIQLVQSTYARNVIIKNTIGHDRAVLYLLAGTTGLRRNELLCLIWDDINLSGKPFVRVRSSIAKNGKEALQPIPAAAIAFLTALKAYTKPEADNRVFSTFTKSINTAELVRSDLTAAKIPLIDKDGNEICFHSLRNSYISFLANSATPAKVIQKLARHSDPKLTFNTYARTFEESEQKAMNFLPNFGNIFTEKSLCASLCKDGRKEGISIDKHRQSILDNQPTTAFLVGEQRPMMGVEPISGNLQGTFNKELTENTNSGLCASLCKPLQKESKNSYPVLSTCLDKTLQKHPDLEQIISAWPSLPDHTKEAIKALIQTHKLEKK